MQIKNLDKRIALSLISLSNSYFTEVCKPQRLRTTVLEVPKVPRLM